MKARFFSRQEDVTIRRMDGMVYIFLCLHEQKIEETTAADDGSTYTQDVYEYDYTEIIEQDGILDMDDVMSNPEAYLDYEPYTEEPDSLEKHRADIDYIAMETGVDL